MRPKGVLLAGRAPRRGGVTMGGGYKHTTFVLWDADELEHIGSRKHFESIDEGLGFINRGIVQEETDKSSRSRPAGSCFN